MATLEEIQIETDLKDIENKIIGKKSFTREDIQNALNKLRGKNYSQGKKKEILTSFITRTGVKVKGIKNLYTQNEELSIEDKTFGFLNDLNSYQGFIEKEK